MEDKDKIINEYKEAFKQLKEQLNAIVIFNSKLGYVNKLLIQNDYSKEEKVQIFERFDGLETIQESKNLYKELIETKFTPL